MKKLFSSRTTTWAMFCVVAVAWPSTGFSQDSLKEYSVVRWKVDRLIKVALKAKQCDSLVNNQQLLINNDLRLQIKADSVIKAQADLIKTQKRDLAKNDTLDSINKKIIHGKNIEVIKWKIVGSGFMISTGALLGSSFGPAGTLIGAVAGVFGAILSVKKRH
jgi:hypothetical protein